MDTEPHWLDVPERVIEQARRHGVQLRHGQAPPVPRGIVPTSRRCRNISDPPHNSS